MVRAWAPQRTLAAIGAVAIAAFAGAYLLYLNSPWLGLELDPTPDGNGLRVESTAPEHPNSGRIRTGDVLVAADGPAGGWMPLTAETVLAEPDVLDYARLATFYDRQERLAAALNAGSLTVRLADGRTVTLVAQPRPVTAAGPVFLAHAAYGIAGLLIATGIWVFRPRQRAAQLVAVSGVAFLLCNVGPAVYGGRELALDGDIFALLSGTNHFGTTFFVVGLVGLMWVYPTVLGRLPMIPLLFAVGFLSWGADLLHVGDSAAQSHYLPLTLLFLLSLGFTAAQWRATRDLPVERAALRWIILAMLWATTASILLVMTPVIAGYRQLLPQHLVFATLLVMYIGIAAGVVRYRLFDLEAWWLRTWLWVAGGLLVILLDTVLVFVAGLGLTESLLISLLLAGFVYFPIRQWLWERLLPAGDTGLDQSLPRLAAALIGARSAAALGRRWTELLNEAFHPLEQTKASDGLDQARVHSDGITMEVPHPVGKGSAVLRYAAGGTRLFNRRDLRLAQALTQVGHHAAQAFDARAEGAYEERERILRDLHDDIGAKLLTVVHAARDERDQALARSALADLRALVAAREGPSALLARALVDWRAEFEQRVALAGAEPVWNSPGPVPEQTLPARAMTNIGRILREAVSNAIRHASAERIDCTVSVDGRALVITVADDGDGPDPRNWRPGRGMGGMCRRAEEIGAELTFERKADGGIRLCLRYPLPDREEEAIRPAG